MAVDLLSLWPVCGRWHLRSRSIFGCKCSVLFYFEYTEWHLLNRLTADFCVRAPNVHALDSAFTCLLCLSSQTAQPAAESSPSLWLVRPPSLPHPSPFDPSLAAGPSTACVGAGSPVKCGSQVVFEHAGSQALLRAGQAEAPLSSHHGVSPRTPQLLLVAFANADTHSALILPVLLLFPLGWTQLMVELPLRLRSMFEILADAGGRLGRC